MSKSKLTPTSYLVLGTIRMSGPSTPYELKQLVNHSIGHFWSFPHSQLYTEPARLTALGLLREEREESGRRRRRFHLTPAGEAALEHWAQEPTPGRTQAHDLGLLKLFLGVMTERDDVRAFAFHQAQDHRRQLDEYRASEGTLPEGPDRASPRAALGLGMRFEQLAVTFWEEVAANPPAPVPPAQPAAPPAPGNA